MAEQHFDPTLNPINATVSLSLRVLSIDDLGFEHKGGGLFMAYIAMRFLYPETFHHAYEHLSIPMGAVNTVVLLTSSLTMALAVSQSELGIGDGRDIYPGLYMQHTLEQ